VTYSAQQSVASLELLLHQAQDFYSRYVNKNGLAPSAPQYMIAQLTDHHIVELSDKFGKVISSLDFGSMLDYDEYARTGSLSSGRMGMEISLRREGPMPSSAEMTELEFLDSDG
uniref:Uncharacterized protein n=1 Tax=Plectus sambesii TaxID=2011161 RepID=A0A914X6Q5_9BILA